MEKKKVKAGVLTIYENKRVRESAWRVFRSENY